MTNKLSAVLLILFSAILYLLPLQGHPLFLPDETRYAEIPREMLASGDWIVPRLNGVRYFEKPVMGYWLSAISLSVFGENNFAVRFPSALAALLTALLVYSLCRGCFSKESRIPLFASFVYLTSLIVAVLGTLAILDTLLGLFLTATLVFFFKATEAKPSSSRERKLLLTAGIFAGCAFLTKGFLAFAIPVLAAGPYLLLQKRFRDIPRMLIFPVIGALLVSLPWAIRIHQQEADFWNYFFWYEHVHRFLADNAQHAQPFWYFGAALPVLFMPWTFLLPAALSGARHAKRATGKKRRLLIFCLCWLFFPLLFFSVSSGKLITYILPCFPAISVLFTVAIFHWIKSEKRKREYLQWGIAAMSVLVALILIAVAGLHLFGPEHLQIYTKMQKWLLLVCSLGGMLVLLAVSYKTESGQKKLSFFGLSFALLLFTFYFAIPTQTLERKAVEPLFDSIASEITPDVYVLSGEEVFRAVCWYLKRSDVYIVGAPGEIQYGLKHEGDNKKLLTILEIAPFIRQHSGSLVMILDQRKYDMWKPYLPLPVSQSSTGKKGHVLLTY